MPNPYLDRLNRQYNELRTSISSIHTAAATAPPAAEGAEPGRDLTEAELRSCEAMAEQARELLPQITALSEAETRNREVADLRSRLADNGDDQDAQRPGQQGSAPADAQNVGGDQNRSAGTGGAQTRDRDPGHYRSEAEGGEHSFFGDLVRSREGDDDAERRLNEHHRALSTGTAGSGIVPPNWLISEYEAIARQGRVLSEMVRRVAITNPAPMTLQRQTSGTDSVVATQSTENTHPSETDAFATATDVVVPKPISGIQVISRQMIDMTSPAADALIYGDMLAVYNRKIEDLVTAAWVAAAGSPVVTFAGEINFFPAAGTASTPAGDAITDAAIQVWNARKLPADVVAMRVSRWGKFSKMRDTTGRKMYPASDAGPMNVDGVGSVQSAGNVEGLAVAVTDGLGIGGATYPESILVGRASDTILFEGAMQRFRYEEVVGPESVKLGIWAYAAVIVRQNANSVRRVQITAA